MIVMKNESKHINHPNAYTASIILLSYSYNKMILEVIYDDQSESCGL